MSEPERVAGDDIESVVRAHLEREAERVDAAAGLARVLATLAPELSSPAPAPPRRRFPRRLAWGVGATGAAAVLLVFLVGPGVREVRAETLVREAKQAHGLPIDRCYLVETRLDGADPGGARQLFDRNRVNLLWTRGDRFWVESVDGRRSLVWGRDEAGGVWLAFSPKRGVRLDPDEVGVPLAAWCDVLGMRVETLLGDLLADFDLRRDGAAGPAHTVRAVPKPGLSRPVLRDAVLEIDAETKVVRRAALTRPTRLGVPATVTLTLVETRPRADALYQLEGHLDPDATVYTRQVEPGRRREFLARRFGPPAAQGLPDPDGKKPE